MAFPLLFVLFIAVPLIEIVLFIEIGGLIGTWPTVGIVVLTAVVGASMVRAQGLAVLAQAQRQADAGEPPVGALAHGVMILIAGALLLTPGFFTDAVGFALLVPPVRMALAKLVWAYLERRGSVHVHTETARKDSRTIEGEYRDVTPDGEEHDKDEEGDTNRRSPWRNGGRG